MPICPSELAPPLLFACLPFALENVSVMISESSFPMQIILAETPFVYISICKFENADPVFHPTTPIAFIVSPRQKIISSIPMNLVFNKASWIFFPVVVEICPPAVLFTIFHFSLVDITITICYFKFAITQLLPWYLLKSLLLIIGCAFLLLLLLLIFLYLWTMLQIFLLIFLLQILDVCLQ